MTYGPTWRIDGPLPSPPTYGLLQAASAPAAGVTLVTDVQLNRLADVAAETRERFNAGRVAGVEDTELMAQLYEFVSASDAYAQVSGSRGAGIERWINGVILYPYPQGPAHVWDPCSDASPPPEKDSGVTLDQPVFSAMTVYLAETCSSYKVWDEDAFKARAVLALGAVQGAAIAHEFMSGDVLGPIAGGLNPNLADGNGVFPLADVATTPTEALALLEGQIAASGQFGIIHMSPMMAASLGFWLTFDNKTGVLRTVNGTVVIPDAGYGSVDAVTGVYAGGATPVGHAAATGTQEWLFATGTIEVRLSDVFTTPTTIAEAMDRGSGGATVDVPNSITYRAERYALVDWDTAVQAAVLADRCLGECPS